MSFQTNHNSTGLRGNVVDGSAGNLAKAATPVEAVQTTLDMADRLTRRVLALRDRLLGPMPSNFATTDDINAPGGLLDLMHGHARDVSERINDANQALDQIDRATS